MTHLPFIAAAYGLSLLIATWLAVSAALRLSRARRRLAAVERQRDRSGGDPGRGLDSRSARRA